jgi:Sec-independent protein translocase protein TatA
MAEVLGVVASGITIGALAVQVGSSIKKLKTLWEEIQDAPSSINLLINEVGTLHLILCDIETNQAQNSSISSTHTVNSLSHCRVGAERLKELVEDLSRDINSKRKAVRKFAAFKVVLEKPKIEKYQMDLERAKSSLILAQTLYNR